MASVKVNTEVRWTTPGLLTPLWAQKVVGIYRSGVQFEQQTKKSRLLFNFGLACDWPIKTLQLPTSEKLKSTLFLQWSFGKEGSSSGFSKGSSTIFSDRGPKLKRNASLLLEEKYYSGK